MRLRWDTVCFSDPHPTLKKEDSPTRRVLCLVDYYPTELFGLLPLPWEPLKRKPHTLQLGKWKEQAGFLVSRSSTLPSASPWAGDGKKGLFSLSRLILLAGLCVVSLINMMRSMYLFCFNMELRKYINFTHALLLYCAWCTSCCCERGIWTQIYF